jgi:Polyketide cyclase / dehydrase and lipid transport
MYHMVRIQKTAITTADPATVYGMLLDGPGWTRWSPIDSVELENGAEGVGQVRVLTSGRVTGRDTVDELIPERRFAYRNESEQIPVRNYRGVVDLQPADGGTAITWTSTFDPKYPGTGWLVRRGLEKFIGEMTDGLAQGSSNARAA